MRLNTSIEVEDLNKVLNDTIGSVWLEITDESTGSVILNIDMKSTLSRYVAIGELVKAAKKNNTALSYELFCQFPNDEKLFYEFFNKHGDTL